MPEVINRAFTQMFPSRRREIQNPLRRRAVSTYDAARAAINSPTGQAVQSFLFGQPPVEAPTDPRIAQFGQIVGQTSRGRLADIVNRALPVPVHKAIQFVGDPYEAIEGPLGGSTQAMMGMQKRAKELGLITRVREGNFPYHHIEVFDPQLQTRYIGKKVMGREIDRMGGYDARGQYGGSVAAFVDFQKRPQLTSAGEDLFRLETGLEMKEKPPMYKVAFAKGLGRPDPKNPGDPFSEISIDPAYSGRALEELLQLGAREHPGKIYSVEAELANAGLMRLAENFGILGYEHGYGNNALYFAKKGRFLPLSKAMEEIGVAGPNLGGRTAQQVASEYGLTKKLKKGQARQQRLDYMDLRRRMEAAGTPIPDPNEVPPSAIDWMGEGRDYARTSSGEGPIGFNDVPPSQWDDAYINSYEQAFDYGVDVTDAILSTNPRMDLDTLAAELRAANVEPDIVGEIIQDIQYDRAHGRSGRR